MALLGGKPARKLGLPVQRCQDHNESHAWHANDTGTTICPGNPAWAQSVRDVQLIAGVGFAPLG